MKKSEEWEYMCPQMSSFCAQAQWTDVLIIGGGEWNGRHKGSLQRTGNNHIQHPTKLLKNVHKTIPTEISRIDDSSGTCGQH